MSTFRGRSGKYRWPILIGLAVLILVIVVLAMRPANQFKARVTILDPKLRVNFAQLVQGTNVCYLSFDEEGGHIGGKLNGGVRTALRKWGLPVDVPPRFRPGQTNGAQAFVIGYDYPLPDPARHLEAELVSDQGTILALKPPAGGGSRQPPRYWNLWTVEALPPDFGNFRIRLKLQETEAIVGEVRFEPITPRHD